MMAGCYGNHPIDQMMERQLMRYLNDCDDYEQLCEKITEKVPDDLWDKYDDILNHVVDMYLATRVERQLLSMEQAQDMLLRLAQRINANKIYKERR